MKHAAVGCLIGLGGWLAVAACRRFEYAAAAPDSRLVS